MRIIAFDLGSHMAWAYMDWITKGKLVTGQRHFEGKRAERLAAIANWFPRITKGNLLDVLIYETPFARGRDATRSLWGIAGILEACATNANMAVVDVAVPTLKKFATGDGHAPKVDMIAAAQKFGYKGDNEHEADAVCLLRYAEANLEKVLR